MSFLLKILPRAEKDAQSIFNYIAERSPGGAARWWGAFEAAMAELTRNPKRYAFSPENGPTPRELRQSLFKTPRGRRYRAVFIVVENEVRELRVRGPGQSELELDEVPQE